MTRYAAQPVSPQDRGDGTLCYTDHRDVPESFYAAGYSYIPARPNPDDCEETYRPVTLEWTIPDNGIYHTMPVAVNGWRGNRTYAITTPGATNTYGIMVNGVHIPVEFDTVATAKLFAQHIEDSNTES